MKNVDLHRKRNQIILLEDVIFHIKTLFNNVFDDLQRTKQEEILKIHERNQKISSLMAKLNVSGSLFIPVAHALETPEKILLGVYVLIFINMHVLYKLILCTKKIL